MEFTIPLKPMPSPRRVVTRWGRTYMPAHYEAWKREFKRLFPWQTSRAPLEGPLSIFCEFCVAIPKSYSKTERAAAAEGLRWPSGDVDNHLKSVCDALTERGVWVDDRVVVEMAGRKRYGERDEIRIRIEKYIAANAAA